MSILSQQKQSVNTDFPNVRPSLDLRFALAKELDPRVTFNRGSTGTYFGSDGLMRTAAANEPRFDHDPVTGQSLGLLIEESRTNLVANSTSPTFGVALSGISTTTDGTTAPDGSSAIVYVPNTNKQIHLTTSGITNVDLDAVGIATGSTYDVTYSVWVKDYNNSDLGVYVVNAAFLSPSVTNPTYQLRLAKPKTGTWSTAASAVQTGWTRNYEDVETYPNGWYRFIQSSTYTRQSNQNQLQFSLQIFNNQNTQSYAGDGTSGVYIWAPQVEAGSFPTSYIPTSGSTVTRSADTATMTGTNFSSFFNSTEGTLCVDSEIPYGTLNKFPAIGFSNNGGSGNAIQFFYYYVGSFTTPYIVYLVRNFADASGGGAAAANLIESPSPTQTVGSYKKFIGTYKFGEFNHYFDGKFVARTTRNKRLPTVNLMEIGNNGATVDRMNGHIRRITYYPIALTNQQLINLTS